MIRTSGNGDGVIAASETAEAKENAEKKKKKMLPEGQEKKVFQEGRRN